MTEMKTTKTLESSRLLSGIVKEYYKGIHIKKAEGKKAVWSSGIAPVELFHAMDVIPVFPENYSAACGVKQIGAAMQEHAENAGYSTDLCSYFRTDFGRILSDSDYLGGVPEPDAVVVSHNLCTTHMKWFEVISRRFGCPMFVLDEPLGVLGPGDEPEPHRLAYALRQLEELIEFLERVSGKRLEPGRLEEAVALGDRAAEMWIDINESRRNRPAPISSMDMLSNLFALVVLSGTETAAEFLSAVRKEVRERAARGIGIVPEEKYRLLWDVMPLWYNLGFFERFQQEGAVFVLELYNYGGAWGLRMDPARPLESLARRNLGFLYNIDGPARLRWVSRLIRDFQIDGYVNHVIRSCIVLSTGTYHLANQVRDKLKVPTLTLNSDHCDPRAFAAGQVDVRMEAFLEMLAKNRQ